MAALVQREFAPRLTEPPLHEAWQALQQVLFQDLEPDPDNGGMRIGRGVPAERRKAGDWVAQSGRTQMLRETRVTTDAIGCW